MDRVEELKIPGTEREHLQVLEPPCPLLNRVTSVAKVAAKVCCPDTVERIHKPKTKAKMRKRTMRSVAYSAFYFQHKLKGEVFCLRDTGKQMVSRSRLEASVGGYKSGPHTMRTVANS